MKTCWRITCMTGVLTDGRKSLKLCAVTSAKCMRQKNQVKGSFTASFNPSHVPPTVSSRPPLDRRTRYSAIWLSSSDRKRVLCGHAGKKIKEPTATMMDAIPSIRKNHCQACKPLTPSICSRIPAARNPDMMLEIVFPACHMAILIGDSSLVYQEDVTVLSA